MTKSMTKAEWWEFFTKTRIQWTERMESVFPVAPSMPHCYGCAKQFQIGDILTWNMFGWRFHPECAPEIKLPKYPQNN